MEPIRIGVFVNRKRDKGLTVTKKVIDGINKYGMQPMLSRSVAEELGACEGYSEKEILYNATLAVSLGGDGTLLSTARHVYEHHVPVLGINLGTLGFLAEVEVNEIENALFRISKGDYTFTERMVLGARIIRNDKVIFEGIALNDVVVSRGGLSRIINLMVYVDDAFIDSFPGDGVIVSTPTGSTAYTLSAGGPIVHPELQMMITTPICPHILYSRSFITSPERELSIHIDHDYPDAAILTMDGQEGLTIMAGDRIQIRRMDKKSRFVSLNNINFYDVLRAKIHGRGTEELIMNLNEKQGR